MFHVIGEHAARRGFGTLRLIDGARPRFIPTPVGDNFFWSPDGRMIVYHNPAGLRLREVNSGVDTLVVSNAADGAEAFYAAWSPDGAKLYFLTRSLKGWSIRSIPAAGGASTVLVDFDDPTRQHSRYGFATDGKVFYFAIGSPESDIWVAELEKP